jgi:Mg2+/Co2+ transporter CorB
MLIHPNLLPLLIGSLGGEASPTPPVPSAVAAVLLLCCSAFFSASETALFSLQPVDRRAMADAGDTRVEAMLQAPRATLATLLIGNETVNITLSSVMAGLMLSLAPELPWLNLVVLPPILLVCGEIMP